MLFGILKKNGSRKGLDSEQRLFPLRKICLGLENFFFLEPISCVWELTRKRKIACPRKIFLSGNQPLHRVMIVRFHEKCTTLCLVQCSSMKMVT